MMVFKIDGIVCPLADDVQLPMYNAKRLRSVESWREGDTLRVRVSSTTEVDRLFGFALDLHRASDFNDSYHHAELIVDGVMLFDGRVILLGTENTAKGENYEVEVRSGGDKWAERAARTRLNKSSITCDRRMDMESVQQSWSDDGAVRMLPIRRDSYPEPAATGLYVSQQMLLPQDYHPFISLHEVLRSIMRDSGYTLRSDFLDTEFAKRLMISGAYHRLNVAAAYSQMGFKAMRSASTTATAGVLGRVDLRNPAMAASTGALVDTVNPNVEDEDGVPLGEAYSRGGCFRFEHGEPVFVPKREIKVAFDIHLRYKTDYRILSSKRLKGFDRVYVGNNCYVDMVLQNPFKDMRNSIVGGVQYKLFIFDYDPDVKYYLSGVGEVSEAISTITFDAEYSGTPKLYYKLSDDALYVPYLSDWALYEGYVTERGQRTVELTIRTPFEVCTPTSPRRFNDLAIEGAEAGQSITLLSRCSITPVFGGAAGYGEELTFEDVANHDISQAALMEAVAQMFNLCIYSHKPSHTLYIEPYDTFFNGDVCDWRERQTGESLAYDECATESFECTKLGYQPSDGAAARMSEGKELGMWSFVNNSYAAKHATNTRRNPLFMPTASFSGALSMAPSAEVLTVGDRDTVSDDDYIAPRIVLYFGMQNLPSEERWPAGEGDSYPMASFHSPTHGQTLCYDDLDGCEGLHRYFDSELRQGATRQWLTTKVTLHPEEYITLFDPTNKGATIRSRFRLRIGNDSSLFRLDEIVYYDIESHIATCRFQRLLED